eukprot:TRINITY_DN2286_c0_g1_i3.p1 TRINITY_DN2286_c0_g1~~TRINITY_DN2286_c0_g1_i3.p1  ORF type:complete len:539 (-),score=244.82 TRINITY_DN2286_c0_g1_i3:140-1756(-)
MMEVDVRPPPSALPELATVACCICSAPIKPNPTHMCVQCIRTQVDITEGIALKPTIFQCRGCMRWLKPNWVEATLESRELMAICLRKVSGLNRVKLVDASWVWTEAHSRRLKLKLTVQKEVQNGAILQQALIVEFTVRNQQCTECQASYTNNTWKAVVQIRQRVDHKRTFFYLEQLILKHNAHVNAINVQTHKDGMDFFYAERNQAARMLSFLESVIPCRIKNSKKLISADNHSNTYNFHYTYLVTVAPVCKDDLVLLPARLAETLGQFARLAVVQRISNGIALVDPATAQTADVNVDHYARHEFVALLSSTRLVPFVVLGLEPLPLPSAPTMAQGRRMRRARLAEVTIARECDLGTNDTQFTAISHLGHLLKAGDTVLGYDVASANLPEDHLRGLKTALPDVVLVRKVYTSGAGKRAWRLEALEKDREAELSKRDADAHDADYERFMQQLEADKEMRRQVNLFKDLAIGAAAKAGGSDDDNEVDEEQIRVEELLDDMRLDDPDAAPDDGDAQVFSAGDAPGVNFAALALDDDDDDDL